MLDNTALTLLIEKKLSVNCLHLIIKNAFCIIIGKEMKLTDPSSFPPDQRRCRPIMWFRGTRKNVNVRWRYSYLIG